jgi:hypothetical protein
MIFGRNVQARLLLTCGFALVRAEHMEASKPATTLACQQSRIIAALAARRRLLSIGAIDLVQAGGMMDTERARSWTHRIRVSGRFKFLDARLHGHRLAVAEQFATFDIKRLIPHLIDQNL